MYGELGALLAIIPRIAQYLAKQNIDSDEPTYFIITFADILTIVM